MYLKPEQIKDRYLAMISEILPYTINKRENLNNWTYSSKDETKQNINEGFTWDDKQLPVYFENTIKIDKPQKDQWIYLDLWMGGESLVIIDDFPYGEINPYHRQLNITKFADGKEHKIKIQTVPKKLFGEHQKTPTLTTSKILTIDKNIQTSLLKFKTAIEIMAATPDKTLAEKIKKQLDEGIKQIHIPRNSENYFKGTKDNPAIYEMVNGIWNPEEFPENSGMLLNHEDKQTIINAAEKLDEKMTQLNKQHQKQGKLNLIGHAHIDYAWLWPYAETKRKIVRTFANAVRMTETYPEFKFSQSSAQMYKDLKSSYPELYKKIQELVKQGKWETAGGMWVESDCNIGNVESLIRQFYYGQTYFEKEFGTKNKTCWLPDVFGFNWIIPQILKESEIENFVTIKINWSEKNKFPHDVCKWRGIDGSEVIYFSYANPIGGYNGNTDPESLIKTWEAHREKDKVDTTLLSFGYGDGGGGPTDEMQEKYEIAKNWAGVPQLKIDTVENFFENLKIEETLPTWDGDLYLELHRGTYTSQSKTKYLHKIAEYKLYQAEYYSVIAQNEIEYPEQKIQQLWEILLHTEFHDVIPGSSIKEVYQDSEKELTQLIQNADEIIKQAINSISKPNNSKITIINDTSYERKIEFTAKTNGKIIETQNGTQLKMQKIDEETYIYTSDETIKPFQTIILNITNKTNIQEQKIQQKTTIENNKLKLEVNPDGTIQITDKTNNRKTFKNKGNILAMYKDVPTYWDAWDIEHDYEKYETIIKADSIKLIEDGEIQKTIQVTYKSEGTTIIQNYTLKEERLDINTKIDWHTRRTMLRAKMPFNVHTRNAKCDLSAGYIERPTHTNTSWEEARFEVLAHRWIDLSEYNYGYALLNDSKYGYKINQNEISINLLRGPIYPAYFADEGKHEFTYSIYPHNNSDIQTVIEESEKLNKPLMTKINSEIQQNPIMQTNKTTLKITAIKQAKEKGNTIRLVEMAGGSGTAEIKINIPHKKIYKTNLLENNKQELKEENGIIKLEYNPFKIYTLVVE